jgi:diguanylate cyclase (GGDEF)-like protein/PAS domain S-box-containing protein
MADQEGTDRTRTAVVALGALTAYLAAAIWADQVSLPGSVLVWFPPAGVAVALAYFRPRLALPVLVAAEVISTAVIMEEGASFGVAALLVNAIGLAVAYEAGGWVLRRLAIDPLLRSTEDVAVAAVGIVVAASLATVSGIAVQRWQGLVPADELWSAAGLFWVGDVVGATCLVPALLVLGSTWRLRRPLRLSDGPAVPAWQLAAEVLAPALVAIVLLDVGQRPLRFTYLAYIPVLVVASRHGVRGASVSVALLSAVMTAGAHAQLEDVLARSDFQLLLLVLTLTGVVTGAAVSGRRVEAEDRERVREIVDATPDLVASASQQGHIHYLNPVGRRLMGFEAGGADTHAFDFLPDRAAEALIREGMRTAVRTGAWTGDNRLLRADGHVFPVSQVLIAHPRLLADGQRLYSTICRDTTAQHELEEQLRRAVLYDEATGLPNRALLVEQLARSVAGTTEDRHVAVLIGDIDHLERVVDTFGFAATDELVATMAGRILGVVRNQHLVARHGATQFVVVVAEVVDEVEAVALADRLLGCFDAPVRVGDHELHVTGSVGITLVAGGQDHMEGLRGAEIALHRAKEAGGGRFTLFDDELERRSRSRLDMEADLHDMLTHRRWWLEYQPIVDTSSRRVVGVEALLRWTHPSRGAVPPFDLIRLAEHSGTIVALGHDIFERACRAARSWHDLGFDIPVSINVSIRQLREPSFLDDVRATLEATGVAAERVVLELTETVLATNDHGEIDALHQLRALGCRVALDDFGTGYSSLSELRNLPIDVVKLDQSFITGLTTSPRAAAMVEAVIHLADALELVVVAEGVEEDAQVDALASLGCHRLQGFALFRPMPAEMITAVMGAPDHGGA